MNVDYQFPATTDVVNCVRQAGMTLDHRPGSPRIQIHLDLYLEGGLARVPAGIGVNPANGDTAGTYTTFDTGIVNVTTDREYTLGQFFTAWGHPLGDNSIGAIRALPGTEFNWFVNGGLTTDPAHVVLHNHDDIELFADAKGANIAPPPAFEWPNATG